MTRTDDDTWDLASSVGATATAVAASRATASQGPDALLDDPWAEPLVRAVAEQNYTQPYPVQQEAILRIGAYILCRCKHAAKFGVGGNDRGMGLGHSTPGTVVHRHRLQVLNQGAATVHIQGLQAEADGKGGDATLLAELEEKSVDALAIRIGR